MIIALDYDDCYTRDPRLWEAFVTLCYARGHRVICVTARDMNHQIASFPGGDVVYAGRRPKRAAAEAAGYKVDIWIDDLPEMVGTWNFDTNPGCLE